MVTREDKLRSIERRKVLEDWIDSRVSVAAVLVRVNQNRHATKHYRVALVEDCEVTLPNRAVHTIGHVWIQHAEALDNVPMGRRVRCLCGVYTYWAKTGEGGDAGERVCGLRYPSDVSVLPEAISYRTEQPLEPVPLSNPNENDTPLCLPPARQASSVPIDPIELIIQARDLVVQAGGLEGMLVLQDAINRAGGWEKVQELERFSASIGGWERFDRLLSLLKI